MVSKIIPHCFFTIAEESVSTTASSKLSSLFTHTPTPRSANPKIFENNFIKTSSVLTNHRKRKPTSNPETLHKTSIKVFTRIRTPPSNPSLNPNTSPVNSVSDVPLSARIHNFLHGNCDSAIIDGLCKDGLLKKGMELFLEMKGLGIVPNVVVYNSMIHGLCYEGKLEAAKTLLNEMVDQGVHHNTVTFNILIDMLCKKGNIKEANDLLEVMIKRGESPDLFTYNAMMDGFCLAGRLDEAKELFISIYVK